jgi:putrescine aminotransferase
MSPRQLFLRHLAQTSPSPLALEVEHAKGCYLYTPEGRPVLDLIAGISVSALGHGHPQVLAAIHAQVEKYMHVHVYGETILSPQVELATALSDTVDAALPTEDAFPQKGRGNWQTFFVSSGSEAIEGAIKLARRATARVEIVSFTNSYHGSTYGALAASGAEELKSKVLPLPPGFKHIAYGDIESLSHITCRTAAVLIESIQGEAGVRHASPQFWAALQARCRFTNTLLMVDEIQTGFGRTGTFWAFEQNSLVPDVIVTAKGMGGGMPLGAFIAPAKLMASFTMNPVLGHITTFGGHPVACAASLATLKVIRETVLETVLSKSEFLKNALAKNVTLGPYEVRAHGLLMALELNSAEKVQKTLSTLLALGAVSDWFLYCDTALRIAPPLIISEQELASAVDLLAQAIAHS